MICHAADFDGLHLVLSRDAAEKRPESVSEQWGDEGMTFLGAEDAMMVGADIGHAEYSAVPSGLGQFQTLTRR